MLVSHVLPSSSPNTIKLYYFVQHLFSMDTICQEMQRTKAMTVDQQFRSLASRWGIEISQGQVVLSTSCLCVK